MIITTTGTAFILLGFGLGFCGWFFLNAFKKSKTNKEIGLLLSVFFIGYCTNSLTFGLGITFFSLKLEIFRLILTIAHIQLALLALIGIEMVRRIFWPNSSFIFIQLLVTSVGILAVLLTTLQPITPIFVSGGSFDFNLSPKLSLMIWILSVISIGASFFVFSRLFLFSNEKSVRVLSLLIVLLALLGIINVSIRLSSSLSTFMLFKNNFFDIAVTIIGLSFIILLPMLNMLYKKNSNS